MPSRTAGTDPVWSAKDRQEQAYVSDHVRSVIAPRSVLIDESEPHTVEAADLLHLRTDFSFRPRPGVSLAEILHALHPTPAVCGLPKEEAFRFILGHEHGERSYYSGFMGPFGLNGSTHLFVTLRCMRIFSNACRLYAGGGLLTDSVEEQEWQETEAKLDTMRRLLAGC
jgi:isochorismate synthase